MVVERFDRQENTLREVNRDTLCLLFLSILVLPSCACEFES